MTYVGGYDGTKSVTTGGGIERLILTFGNTGTDAYWVRCVVICSY